MRLVILGAPRTKKNHTRIIRVKGRPRIIQAASHDAWANAAILQARSQFARVHLALLERRAGLWTSPCGLRALIYRERRTGDLGNYLAAICDVLERAGVVENDRLIESFDGSRLFVDAMNPRVEIELTPL